MFFFSSSVHLIGVQIYVCPLLLLRTLQFCFNMFQERASGLGHPFISQVYVNPATEVFVTSMDIRRVGHFLHISQHEHPTKFVPLEKIQRNNEFELVNFVLIVFLICL